MEKLAKGKKEDEDKKEKEEKEKDIRVENTKLVIKSVKNPTQQSKDLPLIPADTNKEKPQTKNPSKSGEIPSNTFYSKKQNENTDSNSSNITSSFVSDLSRSGKPKKQFNSPQSSPVRKPSNPNYLPFSHGMKLDLRQIDFKPNYDDHPQQGTRFIVKGGDPEVVLRLICVTKSGEYALFNKSLNTVEWRSPHSLEEVGVPTDDS